MNSTYGSDPFSSGRRGGGGWPNMGPGVWEGLDQLRETFEKNFGSFDKGFGPRAGKGDVRAAVIALLAEEPMHGYQIIREIDERSGGTWKPSPGSVYPTLQMLADEGLIEATESGGKKTYALTDAGREEADAAGERPAPWETSGKRDSERYTALPKAGMRLAQVVSQVAREGSPEQVEQAEAVLNDARRKLFSILAQD